MATRELTRSFLSLRADVKAKVARRRQMATHSPDVHHEGNSLMRNAEIRSGDIDLEAPNTSENTPVWVDAVLDVNIHISRVKELSMYSCRKSDIFEYLRVLCLLLNVSGKIGQNAYETINGSF